MSCVVNRYVGVLLELYTTDEIDLKFSLVRLGYKHPFPTFLLPSALKGTLVGSGQMLLGGNCGLDHSSGLWSFYGKKVILLMQLQRKQKQRSVLCLENFLDHIYSGTIL